MMNRKPGLATPPEVKKNERSDTWIREIRKYKVITPLFGGGEQPQQADSITTVRASEVRGHLRFWWRATRGGLSNGDLALMKKREEEIWGSAAEKGKVGPSEVSVRIVRWTNGKLVFEQDKGDKKVHIADPGADWSYVAFPLREEKDKGGRKKDAGFVREDVEFDLEISYPKALSEDVEAALQAWEIFGGIGARTRRGFGALQRDTDKPARDQVDVAYVCRSLPSDGKWPAGVPHLSKERTKVIQRSGDVQSVWIYLFKKLREFRQARDKGATSPFGRSKWPEPDTIRRRTGAQSKHAPVHPVEKFPRGKFGLPILFKFKDDDKGEPQATTLQGKQLGQNKSIDRLASPLILRPIACSDGAVGLTTILEWETVESDEAYTPPGGLRLTADAYGEFVVYSDLDRAEAANIDPIKNIKGKPEPDVLQAFLDFLG